MLCGSDNSGGTRIQVGHGGGEGEDGAGAHSNGEDFFSLFGLFLLH